jgi:MFS family permease
VRPTHEQVGDGGDGGVDGPFADVAEACDQRGRRGCVGHAAVAADSVQPGSPLLRCRDHGCLVGTGRQRLVSALTATLSCWQVGRYGDRHGHARLLSPALLVAALGMAAMISLASPMLIFASMVLFGAGFGVIENATFALLIEQLPEAKASTLWNFAYDAGYGAGPAVFGLFAARTGYPAAFALTGGILVLAAVPAARPRDGGVAERLIMSRDTLISGASVAGPALAWWLARRGFRPVIVERSGQLRGGGCRPRD